MLDPPVLASAELALSVNVAPGGTTGSPKIAFYMALTPTLDFINDTYWPGPVFPSPGAAPDSGLTVLDYRNIMPIVGGARQSTALTESDEGTTVTFILDAGQMSRIIDDQPGKTAWDLNFTIVGVLDDELDGFPAVVGTSAKIINFASEATTAAILTIEYINFNTGFMTNAEGATRAVMDSRFGIPSLSAELVEDKYLPGIWVRSEHQDPDDGVVRYPKRPERRTDRKPVS